MRTLVNTDYRLFYDLNDQGRMSKGALFLKAIMPITRKKCYHGYWWACIQHKYGEDKPIPTSHIFQFCSRGHPLIIEIDTLSFVSTSQPETQSNLQHGSRSL